jgi:hypothetical protein
VSDDLELNININPDTAGTDKVVNDYERVEKAHNKLAGMPEVDLGAKVKADTASAEKLSYTWDSIYAKELKFIKDKASLQSFTGLLGSESNRKAMRGETVEHSRAVAQGALGLAEQYKYKGNTDNLIFAALSHESVASATLKNKGFERAASLFGRSGTSQGSKIFKEADWLLSRPYASSFMKNGEVGEGTMSGLRAEAIKRGDAKAGKGGFLSMTVDEEEKAAKSAKKHEESWYSSLASAGKLYGIMRAIAALGLAAIYTSIKETEKGSDLVQGGLGAFTGTTNSQSMNNELIEKKARIPAGSINAAVTRLAIQRGAFKTKGEGELFWKAFSGDISGLMTGNKPMQEVYGEASDRLIKQVSAAKGDNKLKLMAAINTNFGPEMLRIVNLGISTGTSYAQMGARMGAGSDAGGYSTDALARNDEMQTSLNGIADAWRDLFAVFTDSAVNPFLKDLAELSQGLSHLFGNAAVSKKEDLAYGIYKHMLDTKENDAAWGNGAFGTLAKSYDKAKKEAEDTYSKTPEARSLIANRMNAKARADYEAGKEAYVSAHVGGFSGAYSFLGGATPETVNMAKTYAAFKSGPYGSLIGNYPNLADPTKNEGKFNSIIPNALDLYNANPSKENLAAIQEILSDFVDATEAAAKENNTTVGVSLTVEDQTSGGVKATSKEAAVTDSKTQAAMTAAFSHGYTGLNIQGVK